MIFSPDAGLFIWTLLTFGALVALLARFAFPPLRKALEAREAAIRRSLEKAEQAAREADLSLARSEENLAQGRNEARRIIAEGRRIVEDMKREARETAKQESDRMVVRARGEIERETQKSLDDLKTTVANLSVRVARQVIKEQIDEERHEVLVEDFVERLKKSHARQP